MPQILDVFLHVVILGEYMHAPILKFTHIFHAFHVWGGTPPGGVSDSTDKQKDTTHLLLTILLGSNHLFYPNASNH